MKFNYGIIRDGVIQVQQYPDGQIYGKREDQEHVD